MQNHNCIGLYLLTCLKEPHICNLNKFNYLPSCHPSIPGNTWSRVDRPIFLMHTKGVLKKVWYTDHLWVAQEFQQIWVGVNEWQSSERMGGFFVDKTLLLHGSKCDVFIAGLQVMRYKLAVCDTFLNFSFITYTTFGMNSSYWVCNLLCDACSKKHNARNKKKALFPSSRDTLI